MKYLRDYVTSFVVALTIALPLKSQAMEPKKVEVENTKQLILFPSHPYLASDTLELFVKDAVQDSCNNIGHATPLALVSKAWNAFIKNNRPLPTNMFYKTPHNLEQSCLINIFMKGKLVYRPNLDSDEGIIHLKFSDLASPLSGEFDLSQCGDAGNYLSIHTGHHQEMTAVKEDDFKINYTTVRGKLEIWFSPQFLVKKAHNKRARGDFACCLYNGDDINFPKWNSEAQIGIFWWANGIDHQGNETHRFDYLTHKKIDEINFINLSTLREDTPKEFNLPWNDPRLNALEKFHIHFK